MPKKKAVEDATPATARPGYGDTVICEMHGRTVAAVVKGFNFASVGPDGTSEPDVEDQLLVEWLAPDEGATMPEPHQEVSIALKHNGGWVRVKDVRPLRELVTSPTPESDDAGA